MYAARGYSHHQSGLRMFPVDFIDRRPADKEAQPRQPTILIDIMHRQSRHVTARPANSSIVAHHHRDPRIFCSKDHLVPARPHTIQASPSVSRRALLTSLRRALCCQAASYRKQATLLNELSPASALILFISPTLQPLLPSYATYTIHSSRYAAQKVAFSFYSACPTRGPLASPRQ